MRDRGSTLVMVMLVAVAVSWSVVMAINPLVVQLRDQQRAQQAADAGALAGVTGGEGLATSIVQRNGGELVGWQIEVVAEHHRVTVIARVGDREASARATDEP